MEFILCRVVKSSCLPTHSIVPHISWHDPPCHKTMKKYEDFEGTTSLLSTFHIGSRFCFFPANFMSSTYTDKNNPFSRCTKRDISNLEFSPSHVSKIFSQIAFPKIVLPTDDHTDFAQEERLGLPYWTMILAICVVVDESKCLDTPILEFSIICEHLPFSLGYKLILRLLLVHRNQAIWR